MIETWYHLGQYTFHHESSWHVMKSDSLIIPNKQWINVPNLETIVIWTKNTFTSVNEQFQFAHPDRPYPINVQWDDDPIDLVSFSCKETYGFKFPVRISSNYMLTVTGLESTELAQTWKIITFYWPPVECQLGQVGSTALYIEWWSLFRRLYCSEFYWPYLLAHMHLIVSNP